MKKLTTDCLNQINGGVTYWDIIKVQVCTYVVLCLSLDVNSDTIKKDDFFVALGNAVLIACMLQVCWDVLSYTIYGAQNDGAQDVENLDSK